MKAYLHSVEVVQVPALEPEWVSAGIFPAGLEDDGIAGITMARYVDDQEREFALGVRGRATYVITLNPAAVIIDAATAG